MVQVIAEAGINHNGKLENALMLCGVAKSAGADAIKFQLYDPDTMVKEEMAYVLRRYRLSDDDHKRVVEHCHTLGIQYMASCFSEERVDFALSLGCDRIKLGSGEITNYDLIRYIATKAPMILSTGMSDMNDIFLAVMEYRKAGGKDYALLHCVSNYPTLPEHCNVRAVTTLQANFAQKEMGNAVIGYSDHSLYDAPSVMAVGLGAKIIEKHFTLDRGMEGPDHEMSLEPDGLKRFVRAIRVAEMCAGDGNRNKLQPGELEMREKARDRWCDSA
jgi:N,N'-diacetyllegionaminate synthase